MHPSAWKSTGSLSIAAVTCRRLSGRSASRFAALAASEHPVLATDLYEQGLPVRDYYTKRLFNRINALPAGNVHHPVQIEATRCFTRQTDVSKYVHV